MKLNSKWLYENSENENEKLIVVLSSQNSGNFPILVVQK